MHAVTSTLATEIRSGECDAKPCGYSCLLLLLLLLYTTCVSGEISPGAYACTRGTPGWTQRHLSRSLLLHVAVEQEGHVGGQALWQSNPAQVTVRSCTRAPTCRHVRGWQRVVHLLACVMPRLPCAINAHAAKELTVRTGTSWRNSTRLLVLTIATARRPATNQCRSVPVNTEHE